MRHEQHLYFHFGWVYPFWMTIATLYCRVWLYTLCRETLHKYSSLLGFKLIQGSQYFLPDGRQPWAMLFTNSWHCKWVEGSTSPSLLSVCPVQCPPALCQRVCESLPHTTAGNGHRLHSPCISFAFIKPLFLFCTNIWLVDGSQNLCVKRQNCALEGAMMVRHCSSS